MSCSDDETNDSDNEQIALDGVKASLGLMNEESSSTTKAIADFVVNKAADPTSILTSRYGWNFDIQIYKGNVPYLYGGASLEWNDSIWIPKAGQSLYFPNYTRQGVAAKLYPSTWVDTVAVIQNTAALLLGQDVLKQNGSTVITVNPAHIPTIPMRHGNSMLDFILTGVDTTQIASINVYAGNKLYTPYKVPGLNRAEYLVILPVGSQNPEIRLTTVGGARYIQKLSINSMQINNCYCIKFHGLELELGAITVTDWVYGTAISGEYSTETSYPSFLGPPNSSLTIVYDNGLEQVLIFNARGEYIAKPDGRTAIKIILSPGDEFNLNPAVVLRNMVIDLKPNIQNRT